MNRFKFFVLFLLFSVVFKGEAGANIVLKVIAVNPSKEEAQWVVVKTALPKEVSPEDVVDEGDLEIVYDAQEGSYVVYGNFKLKPGETLEKSIEIRDTIWTIPDSELEGAKKDLVKFSGLLKNTRFSERFVFLKDNIESKLNQIIVSQKDPPSNPEQFILNYRENLNILKSAKADLDLIRGFLTQVRIFPATTIWRIIILIAVFLGLLSATFCFLWQARIKNIRQHDTSPVFKEEINLVAGSTSQDHEEKESK
ncbi:MAG: hypothetical protein PHV44_07460 [Candidatus Omnitrophica bacterium]|nr:hypothetical protein [Candidatus Omnitrophota bacterium]